MSFSPQAIATRPRSPPLRVLRSFASHIHQRLSREPSPRHLRPAQGGRQSETHPRNGRCAAPTSRYATLALAAQTSSFRCVVRPVSDMNSAATAPLRQEAAEATAFHFPRSPCNRISDRPYLFLAQLLRIIPRT